MTAGGQWSASFAGASANAMNVYDQVFVPRLFTPWADLLLDLLDVRAGEALLDVATGPGTLARLAAARGLNVTGADLSLAMLAIAQGKGDSVTYVQCPADALAVPDASFDVVTCQQGLQFFPDQRAALREMRRASRPGARLGVAVWNDIEESPFFAALARAAGRAISRDAQAAYRDGPWGLTDPKVLASLVKDAGYDDVRVEARSLPVTFEGGPLQVLSTLAAASIAPHVAAMDDVTPLEDAAREELAPFVDDSGAVVSHATSHVVTACAA
jgi:ubiquinone/menaquinone biosynthesis C-methylase UbiE